MVGRESIPIEQKRLLVGCMNRSEFEQKFYRDAGDYVRSSEPTAVYHRVAGLWGNRDRHLREVQEVDRTVMIPRQIRKPMGGCESARDSLPDVGDLLVRQNNLLAENNILLKELLAIEKQKLDMMLKAIPQPIPGNTDIGQQ